MNKNQFSELCRISDEILLQEDSSMERIAIPWLHIIRWHPIYLNNYNSLFINKFSFQTKFKEYSKGSFYFTKQIGKFFFKRILNITSQEKLVTKDNKIDFLFVSHLLNESHLANDSDFYFDIIPNELKKSGYSVIIVLINHTNISSKILQEKFNKLNKSIDVIILLKSLSIKDEIFFLISLFTESIKLKKLAFNESNLLKKNILFKASSEAVSENTINVLRMSKQIEKILKSYFPRVFITTHEGHSWERLFYCKARQSSKDIICVGYQHSLIFNLQHSITRNLSFNFNPNYIFTSGKIGMKKLLASAKLDGINYDIIGSNRGFKNLPIQKIKTINSKKVKCVVIPEAIESECEILFKSTLEYAQILPEVDFIWRLHPLMQFKNIKSINLNKLPNNIILSKCTLDEDFEQSKFVIYRGSTAVVKAITYNLIPIYLNSTESEVTIDPLYEIDVYKKCINSAVEFKNIIEHYNLVESNLVLNEKNIFTKYCDDLFAPINLEPLIKLVK